MRRCWGRSGARTRVDVTANMRLTWCAAWRHAGARPRAIPGVDPAACRLPWLPLDPGASRAPGSTASQPVGETPDCPNWLRDRCRSFVPGLAVTVRASSVFVRADSSSPVVMVTGSPDLLERHSGFVRASRFQRCPFDLLRLTGTTCLHALVAM
jgi:hypothetical protein